MSRNKKKRNCQIDEFDIDSEKQDGDAVSEKKMKKCRICGKMKPIEDFNYWNKSKGSRMSICKECEHEKSRQTRDTKKQIITDLKEVGCAVCGEQDPICLDFHHYDPTEKSFNMSAAVMKTLPDMLNEASKCVVVCANCHRKIHAGVLNIQDYVSEHEYEYRRKLIQNLIRAYKDNGIVVTT